MSFPLPRKKNPSSEFPKVDRKKEFPDWDGNFKAPEKGEFINTCTDFNTEIWVKTQCCFAFLKHVLSIIKVLSRNFLHVYTLGHFYRILSHLVVLICRLLNLKLQSVAFGTLIQTHSCCPKRTCFLDWSHKNLFLQSTIST